MTLCYKGREIAIMVTAKAMTTTMATTPPTMVAVLSDGPAI